MRRAWVTLLVLTLIAGLTGCGGRGDRGKNADFDRPKSTERR
jgi:predicted small lipoprotein YifL